MGVAPRTRVITCRGKKNPRVKQDGKREFITVLEAVSEGGFLSSYLIGKGSTHIFDWYKHVEAEDREALWEVSLKGWTDNKIGYDWLSNVSEPPQGSLSRRIPFVDTGWSCFAYQLQVPPLFPAERYRCVLPSSTLNTPFATSWCWAVFATPVPLPQDSRRQLPYHKYWNQPRPLPHLQAGTSLDLYCR